MQRQRARQVLLGVANDPQILSYPMAKVGALHRCVPFCLHAEENSPADPLPGTGANAASYPGRRTKAQEPRPAREREEADRRLGVLGMAADGGWWVLGVQRAELADLIADIPTSRSDTGARTLAALRTAGCQVTELPVLSDVDTWEDAAAVAVTVPGGRFAAAVAAGWAALDGRG